MTQAPVALSDFALALEAALFAGLINPVRRVGRNAAREQSVKQPLTRWFELFFYAVAAASLIGGAVHGFVPHPSTAAERAVWPATMVAVGAAAWAAWAIGAALHLSPANARLVGWVATAEFIVYAGAVILGIRSFRFAIFNYLPAVVFLLMVFVLAYVRQRNSAHLLGAFATVITLLAAALQQSTLTIGPLGFTHNVLYHLLQGFGLLLLFMSAQRLRGLTMVDTT